MTNQRPQALDLFCGCGGLSLGLQKAGFEIVLAVDSWKTAISTYNQNFDHPGLQMDLATAGRAGLEAASGRKLKGVDLIVGGPPCQGFSIQRIGPDHDPRNNLIDAFASLVLELQPRMFLMENVPGITGRRGAGLLEDFTRKLDAEGYRLHQTVLDASNFGVPQVRRRFFMVGSRKDEVEGCPFSGLKPFSPPISVRQAIGDLPEPPLGENPSDPLHYRTKLSALNQRRIELIPPGGGFEDLPKELQAKCHRPGAAVIGHRGVYGRLAPDSPSATITARFDSFTRGRFGHPLSPRNLTLREGARLQTFPDHFRFAGTQEEIAAQIGNAVPPRLAHTLACALHRQLGEHRSEDPNCDGAAGEKLELTPMSS